MFDKSDESSGLSDYLITVRDVIVEKKDPYYTLAKNNIKNIIRDETISESNLTYRDNANDRLVRITTVHTSEYVLNLIDIFKEFINSDKGVLNKEALYFLNNLWKDRYE